MVRGFKYHEASSLAQSDQGRLPRGGWAQTPRIGRGGRGVAEAVLLELEMGWGLSDRVIPGYQVSTAGQPGATALDLDLCFAGIPFFSSTRCSSSFLLDCPQDSGKARFLGTVAPSPVPSSVTLLPQDFGQDGSLF